MTADTPAGLGVRKQEFPGPSDRQREHGLYQGQAQARGNQVFRRVCGPLQVARLIWRNQNQQL